MYNNLHTFMQESSGPQFEKLQLQFPCRIQVLGVVGPMLISQLLNIGIIISCCIVLIRHTVKVKKAGGKTGQRTTTSAKQICKMISGLAGIVCLLGLPMLVRFGGAILIVFVKHPTALSILLWLLQIIPRICFICIDYNNRLWLAKEMFTAVMWLHEKEASS